MKTRTSLILALGLSGLAAVVFLLLKPDQNASVDASPNTPVQTEKTGQKQDLINTGQPDELAIIAEPGSALDLARFKSTRLPSETLKRDLELFPKVSTATAKEFREALSHYFPVDELSLGNTTPKMLQCLRERFTAFLDSKPFQTDELGRITPVHPLGIYINVVLMDHTPQDERNRFCGMVDSLFRLYGEHPEEKALTAYLSHILASSWGGWGDGSGKGSAAASSIWHSSEIYRHLVFREPPVTEHFKELVRMLNSD
ncbi:MAG: hypothetical protein R3F13_13510 [Prosthecobacter sp.]